MKNLLTILILGLLGQTVYAQTAANNPCSLPGGAQWTINAPCVSVTTAGYSNLYNGGGCGISGGEPDAWAWFYGDGSNLDVNLTGNTDYPSMNVYSADVSSGCLVTPIGCDNSTGANLNVNFTSTVGQLYFVSIEDVDGEFGYTNTGCLSITSSVPAVYGCTDPAATNYDPSATVDDGTCTYPGGADYFQPTTAWNNEKIGACLVNDCGPFTYADDGDVFNNYSNNVAAGGAYNPNNAVYRVFCPDQAGNCMQVTFNSFVTQTNTDFLWVRNGATEFSPNFMSAPTSTTPWGGIWNNALDGNLNGSCPFSFTSTDDSGCLTFAFLSNGSTTAAGWNATLQCVPCATGPNGTDNNDCINKTPLCSTTTVPGNSSGPGLVSEGCIPGTCPDGGENHTNWYTFTVNTGGTFNFTINPTTNTDDYDYVVFGPNATCASLGTPLRCSDSGVQGNTGVTGGQGGQTTEDVTGNSWTQTMNVVAGETYILMVDEWSANSGSGYDLSFSGTATLDCSVLPVELTDFNVDYIPEYDETDVYWITASERDLDRFEVERSTDGDNYEVIAKVPAAGNTDYETDYLFVDQDPNVGVNYYRLNQIDVDGASKYSEVRAVNILDDFYDMMSVFPNPTTGKTEMIFNSYSPGDANLIVTSADGKVIVNTVIDVVKGGNKATLDLSGQQEGVYLITINTRDKSYKSKLMKN